MNVLFLLGAFVSMEFVAWFTHKFIMHGFMWYFHEDHHEPKYHGLEKNDVFFLIFAIPGILLILFGTMAGFDFKFWIGLGITLYGSCYFLVHDVFIHQRFNWLKRSNNFYLRAIRKAHKRHHKHLTKEDGECFGMLIVPLRYFKEAINSRA